MNRNFYLSLLFLIGIALVVQLVGLLLLLNEEYRRQVDPQVEVNRVCIGCFYFIINCLALIVGILALWLRKKRLLLSIFSLSIVVLCFLILFLRSLGEIRFAVKDKILESPVITFSNLQAVGWEWWMYLVIGFVIVAWLLELAMIVKSKRSEVTLE